LARWNVGRLAIVAPGMEAIDISQLILRLVLGGVMLAHGIKHARGRKKTGAWFGSIGFRAPDLQWFASTATEIGVGLMLIVGFVTAAAVAGVIGILTVAYVSVHRSVGFWVTARPDEGWEYIMALAAIGAAVAITGPGSASIDSAIGLDVYLDGWVGAAALGFGVVAAAVQLATFFRPPVASEPTAPPK